jgi:hypothetical protein
MSLTSVPTELIDSVTDAATHECSERPVGSLVCTGAEGGAGRTEQTNERSGQAANFQKKNSKVKNIKSCNE